MKRITVNSGLDSVTNPRHAGYSVCWHSTRTLHHAVKEVCDWALCGNACWSKRGQQTLTRTAKAKNFPHGS
ncbi:hypothetical protein AAFF_G00267810 [Aldrovandia affinis]|uniref:Uncharacterized protein n=1 Tax=Aldrovandia affinis TaxID=143900 RepID=A0AAD7ST84_9TELE|nr:hypothetical protein AAFF_G00267810 [Aldrovandia affinis]